MDNDKYNKKNTTDNNDNQLKLYADNDVTSNIKPIDLKLLDSSNLDRFVNTVNTLSKITQEDPRFISETILKGAAMGLRPEVAYDAFWPIPDRSTGKISAEPKTEFIVGHLLNKRAIEHPFTTIRDCEYVYYYYNMDLIGSIKNVVEQYVKAILNKVGKTDSGSIIFNVNKNEITSVDVFMDILLKKNLYVDSDPNVKNEKRSKIKVMLNTGFVGDNDKPIYIPERVTEMEAVRRLPNGELITMRQKYYLSWAIEQGIYFAKNGTVKQNWKDVHNMMRKRCSGKLASKIAPDMMYGFDKTMNVYNEQIGELELQEDGGIEVIDQDVDNNNGQGPHQDQ